MSGFGSRRAPQEPGDIPLIRRAALDLLARREHCVAELRQKLLQRFSNTPIVDEVLAALRDEKLLDDERFIEAFLRAHRNRGQGPYKILHELRQRGVDADLAEAWVDPRDASWVEDARRLRERRFGPAPPAAGAEWQRQARHLQSRGFSTEQVSRAFRPAAD